MTSSHTKTWALRLTAAGFFGAMALLPASSASAHSELIESTPTSGAELSKAPTEVQLTFGEPVQQQGGSIVVSANDTIISQPKTFAADGNVASVQLVGSGQPGTYTVNFRVVSADGHVVSDAFTYEVVDSTSSTTTGAATADQSAPTTAPSPSSPPGDSNSSVVWVLGLGAIGIVLVIAVIAVAVRGRRERSD
jgi:methionine-rich copper-binding protein CopC